MEIYQRIKKIFAGIFTTQRREVYLLGHSNISRLNLRVEMNIFKHFSNSQKLHLKIILILLITIIMMILKFTKYLYY